MTLIRNVLAFALIAGSVAPGFAEPPKDAGTTATTSGAAKTGDAAKAADTKSGEAKSSDTKQKFTSAQIKAFLAKCSDEADAKGLMVSKGKAEARKAFRRECMHKLGVDPR